MEDDDDGAGKRDSESVKEWAEIIRECLISILLRLPLEDRWKGPMFVCKSWLSACMDPCMYSSFDLEPQFGGVYESSSWWSTEFERKVDSMLSSAINSSDGGLTEIRIRHCSDRSLNLIAERCPKLQILSIKSCPHATDASIARIAVRCPDLKELDISYCYEISHESLALIGQNCPDLYVLKRNFMNWLDPSQHERIVPAEYLNAMPQDGDREASAIGKFMPRLKTLELRFSKLSAMGLALICEGCPNLEYLDLSGCANLTSRDIWNSSSNLKNLKVLKKPNFYIPRSIFHTERYGHWRLYDERFQTDVFRI